MTAKALAVELVTARVRDAREVLRVLKYAELPEPLWPVTLRLMLIDVFVRRARAVGIPPPVRDIEEALGLLAMLKELDHELWATQVIEIWPDVPRERLHSSSERGLDSWGLLLLAENEHGFPELQECHRSRQQEGQSANYQEALELVRSVRDGDIDDSWYPKVPMYIGMFGQVGPSKMTLLAETHAMYRREDPAPIFFVQGARMVSVSLNLTAQALTEVQSLYESGLAFRACQLSACTLPCSIEYKLPLLKVLLHMFGFSISVPHYSGGLLAGMKYLTISNKTPSYWIPALLSAAHRSESLTTIRIENSFNELRHDNRLAWILYAVFRREAPLKTVQLNCIDLEEQDVALIQATIAMEDPLSVLVNGTDAVGQVVASRFDLHGTVSDPDEEFITAQPLAVPMLDVSEDHDTKMRVLLPGYGGAWVRRENVLETVCEEKSRVGLASVGAVSLQSVSAASGGATIGLLRVILPRVTRLEVEFCEDFGTRLVDGWLQQLVDISANLAKLMIKASLFSNLDTILDGFVTGALHLSKLEIESVLSGDGSQVERFFDALGDRRHPIGVQLSELSMVVVIDTEQGEGFIESVKQMLGSNQRLTKFKIRILTVRGLQIPAVVFNPIRERNRDDSMVLALETRKKLAFLSVITTSSATCPSMTGLNSIVISMIFDFSAATHKRKVEVEVGGVYG